MQRSRRSLWASPPANNGGGSARGALFWAVLSLRAHALITAAIFVAIVGLAMLGNALEASGMITGNPAVRLASMIIFFGLCLALVFSSVPLMVKLVLGFQVTVGNAGNAVVGRILARERVIVLTLWALLALGLAIAVPAAIIDGAFD
jgi:hypothetical protein